MWRLAALVVLGLEACSSSDRVAPKDVESTTAASPPPPPQSSPPSQPFPDAPGPPRKPPKPFRVAGIEREAHKPLVAMMEHDPWRWVVGSDVASFVLYDDGLVLASAKGRGAWDTGEAHLDPAKVSAVVDAVVSTGVLDGPDTLVEVGISDQQSAILAVRRDDGSWKATYAYAPDRRAQSRAMWVFQRARDALRAVLPASAPAWSPDELELMIVEAQKPSDAMPWPRDVPAPPASLRSGDMSVARHYLAPADVAKLRAADPDFRRPLAANGHTWVADGVRPMLPADLYLEAIFSCAVWVSNDQTPKDPACSAVSSP